MAVSVTNQLHVFLLSLTGGVLVGIFFDMFRTLRRLVKSSTVFVGIQDTVFWLLFAGAVFFFIYRFNYGQPRWYIFCGILLGALFYHLILGDKMVQFFLLVQRGLFFVFRFILRISLFPLYLIYRFFLPFFRFGKRIYSKISHSIQRKIRREGERIVILVKKIKKRRKMY